MTKIRFNIIAAIAGWVFLLLFVFGTMAGPDQLWGINLVSFFSPTWRYLIVILAFVLSVPFIENQISQVINLLSGEVNQTKIFRIGIPVVVAAIFLFLSFKLIPVSKFLGDATLRVNQIERNQVWLPTEALDFFLHSILYKYVFKPMGMSAIQVYNFVSSASGAVFIFGIFRLGLYIRQSQVLINFLIMASSGVVVLFFGYVESYSIIAALLPWLVLQALKVFDGNSARWKFVMWYILGAVVHSVSAIIFFGALVSTFIIGTKLEISIKKRPVLYIWIIPVAVVCLLYCLKLFNLPILDKLLLPIYSSNNSVLAFLSSEHFWNVANWLLLTGLSALFVIVQLLFSSNFEQKELSSRNFLPLSMMIPSLFFVLFFAPHLGGPRDWDLFSLPIFVLIPASLVLFYERFDRSLPRQWFRITFIALVISGSFVLINNSPAKSVRRFESILATSHNKNLFWEYIYLHDFCSKYPELEPQKFTYITRAWNQNRNQNKDSVIVITRVANALREGPRPEPIIFPLSRILGIDKTDTAAYMLVAASLINAEVEDPELLILAHYLLQTFPDVGRAQMYAGYIFQSQNMENLSGPCFTRSFELDSTDLKILINYSTYIFNSGNYEQSKEILLRAADIYPNDFQVCHNLAYVLIESKQYGEALKWINRAESLVTNESELTALEILRERLSKIQKE